MLVFSAISLGMLLTTHAHTQTGRSLGGSLKPAWLQDGLR